MKPNHQTMWRINLLCLISIPLIVASPYRFAVDNDECSLHIGERDNLDVRRHRRMVHVNLHPERCENSDVVSIDIPHDGIKRSFSKVKTIDRDQRRRTSESIDTHSLFHYWYGEDASDGSTFNYVQDDDGNIQGSLVDMSNDSVMQFSIEDGNYTAIITGSSDFRPESDIDSLNRGRMLSTGNIEIDFSEDEVAERELLSEIVESTMEDHESTRFYLRTNDTPLVKQGQEQTRALYDDSGANLDVMIVWTKNAECKHFGLSVGCTVTDATKAAMEALINLAIDETNTAFELSGVKTQLFLAKSYRHPTFDEKSMSMSKSLLALRNGGVTGVKDNRKLYGADLVAMISDTTKFCGIAYTGPRVDLMFSVTAWDCATGYFSFGHEIGHNLGLHHDRGESEACDHKKKHHFAYRDPEARYRTILAYKCKRGQCDLNRGGGCPRIQRFSNTKYDFQGLPVGTETENNARKINKMRSRVAQFHPHGGTSALATAEPTSSPTSSPTLSPLPQPPTSFPSSKLLSSCSDSPLDFFYQEQRLNCASVGSQQSLCSDPDVQAICPGTCGTCSNCVDPGLNFEFYHEKKYKTIVKGCDMIADFPNSRCTFYGISDTCRATCGSC